MIRLVKVRDSSFAGFFERCQRGRIRKELTIVRLYSSISLISPLHLQLSCLFCLRSQSPTILLIKEEKVRSSWIAYCTKASFVSEVNLMLIISDLFIFFFGSSTVFPQVIKRFILISFFQIVLQFITFNYQLVTKNSSEKGNCLRLLLQIEIIII